MFFTSIKPIPCSIWFTKTQNNAWNNKKRPILKDTSLPFAVKCHAFYFKSIWWKTRNWNQYFRPWSLLPYYYVSSLKRCWSSFVAKAVDQFTCDQAIRQRYSESWSATYMFFVCLLVLLFILFDFVCSSSVCFILFNLV